MEPQVPPFREAVRLAVEDATTRQHLYERLHRLAEHQRARWQEEETATLRAQATAMRQHVLAHLGELWTLAEVQATALGVEVVWAETAIQAVTQVQDALPKGANVAVIRGVIAEEVGLLSALAAEELTLLVADAGGYVTYLVGERPAHPVVPLAHLGERDVAELWRLYTGHQIPMTKEGCVQAIHAHLRAALSQPGVLLVSAHGIVAETGTPFLFDWEGNIATALQAATQVIVLLGLEQIVPTVDDVLLLAQIWARAALGEPDIPQILYLHPHATSQWRFIVVDNGRTEILAGEWRDVLRCVHCGACATVCPVVQEIGNHVYGLPYAGPVAAVWGPLCSPHTHRDLAWASTLCGACADVCPVGVPLPLLIARARAHVARRALWGRWARWLNRENISSGAKERHRGEGP